MSGAQLGGPPPPGRRIREDVRDGVYVMVFTGAASTGVALGLVLITRWAG